MMTVNSEDFEKKIKYKFVDKGLLKKALTHSSYCRENKLSSVECNERLEFVGDGYLDAIVVHICSNIWKIYKKENYRS